MQGLLKTPFDMMDFVFFLRYFFLMIIEEGFPNTVKLGAPHTIERTRSDGIFLECRRRCRADAWTTRLGMNVRHWGET